MKTIEQITDQEYFKIVSESTQLNMPLIFEVVEEVKSIAFLSITNGIFNSDTFISLFTSGKPDLELYSNWGAAIVKEINLLLV